MAQKGIRSNIDLTLNEDFGIKLSLKSFRKIPIPDICENPIDLWDYKFTDRMLGVCYRCGKKIVPWNNDYLCSKCDYKVSNEVKGKIPYQKEIMTSNKRIFNL